MPMPFARSTRSEETRSPGHELGGLADGRDDGAITGGRRTSEPTGVCHGSTADGSIPSSARTTRRRSVDDRNANPECVPKTSSRYLAIDQVADAILVGAHADDRRHLRQERWMPEDLSLGEQVEHLLFVDELDRTRPHDVEVLRRVTPGLQDRSGRDRRTRCGCARPRSTAGRRSARRTADRCGGTTGCPRPEYRAGGAHHATAESCPGSVWRYPRALTRPRSRSNRREERTRDRTGSPPSAHRRRRRDGRAGPDELEHYGTLPRQGASCRSSIGWRIGPDGKLVITRRSRRPRPAKARPRRASSLTQGLGKIGKKVMLCLREPSMGPVFGDQGRRHRRRLRAGRADGGDQPPLQRRLPRRHGRAQPAGRRARRVDLQRQPAATSTRRRSRGRGRST